MAPCKAELCLIEGPKCNISPSRGTSACFEAKLSLKMKMFLLFVAEHKFTLLWRNIG